MRLTAICMGWMIAFGALQSAAAVEPTPQDEQTLVQELKQKRQLLEKLSAHIKKLEQQLEKMQPAEKRAMRVIAYRIGDLLDPLESKKGEDINFEPLVQFVTTNVSPEHWQRMGGPGTVAVSRPNLLLVISASGEVHERVSGELARIREAKKLLDDLGGVTPQEQSNRRQ